MLLKCVRECYRSRHPQARMTAVGGSGVGVIGSGGVDGNKMLGEVNMVIDGVDGTLAQGRRTLLVHKTTTDSPRSPPMLKSGAVAPVAATVAVAMTVSTAKKR